MTATLIRRRTSPERPALDFVLPPERAAHEPPEARGLARDEVRLLIARRDDHRLAHAAFTDLPTILDAGDLIVINTSATMPAALPAHAVSESGTRWEGLVHLSTRLPAGLWLTELRRASRQRQSPGTRRPGRLASAPARRRDPEPARPPSRGPPVR